MRQTRIMMGMPITVEVVDAGVTAPSIDRVFDYFASVDERFSTYKDTSEISRINAGALALEQSSEEMQAVLLLAESTRLDTFGYFDVTRRGLTDPSGLVKGWAILNGAQLLRDQGFENYYVDAGGDIQASGRNSRGQNWRVGIRNPFVMTEIVKVISITTQGVATSGTSIRGQHIYNPMALDQPIEDVVSLTVIGPNIYEADRFATAAFAMGRLGISFIESLEGFEGYLIDAQGQATLTSGFEGYVCHD